jgi:hypothetical protein
MNETYIQTIRGGIQHVIHLAKDHWTQTPKPCGYYYHHEPYGYIPVFKLANLIRDDWNETYMGWEEYAWLCYENRWLTIEQMAEKMLECASYSGFTEALYKTVEMKYGTESHHTVTRVVIDADGTEYEAADQAKER